MAVEILKDEVSVVGRTATRVSEAEAAPNPKYVLEAVAIQLGLKPSMCQYLWLHYVATVRDLPLVPCIQCGAASEKDLVVDIDGPVFLINRTRTIHKEVSVAYKQAREYLGAVAYTRESGLMLFNGFCEACLMMIEDELPPALKLAVPESPDIHVLRDLVAKVLRQDHTYDAIKALRRVVDPSDWSTA